MRKLVVFLFAVSLLAACNNPNNRNNNNRDNGDNRYDNRDDKNTDNRNDRNDNRDNTDNRNDRNNNARWSSANEDEFVNICVDKATPNVGATRAKEYCNCMLGKLEKAYPDYNEANTKTAAEIQPLVDQCNGVNNNNNNINTNNNNNNGGRWASSEEDQFTGTCVNKATPNVGEVRAKEYCSCMLGKLEKLYTSYDEANRNMTDNDLSKLADQCNGQGQNGNGYGNNGQKK